ncbi:MAG: hypothetical protein ACRDTT_13120, partial [Pseudonocardiaceae bacterium]
SMTANFAAALFGAVALTALRICAQCNGDARPHVGRVNHVIHACRDTRLSHERASSTCALAPHSRRKTRLFT